MAVSSASRRLICRALRPFRAEFLSAAEVGVVRSPRSESFASSKSLPRRTSTCATCAAAAAVVSCWNCKKLVDCVAARHFCVECHLVQPPAVDITHFQLFGLDARFDLSAFELTRRFRLLQSRLHPDKFAQKPRQEREFAAEQSAAVNAAYQTLARPLSRAIYMLERRGAAPVDGEMEQQLDADFLLEMMDLNERASESTSDGEVATLAEVARKLIADLSRRLAPAFADGDLDKAKLLTAQMRYYTTLLENAEKRAEQLRLVD